MGVAATRAAGRPMGLLGRRGWSRPRAYTLASVLPFAAVGRLCLGVIAAGVLRARWPAGPPGTSPGVRASPRMVVAVSDHGSDVAEDATGEHRASWSARFAS